MTSATVERLENYEIISGEYYKAKYFVEYISPDGPSTAHRVIGENFNPDFTIKDIAKEVRKYAKKEFKDYRFSITSKNNKIYIDLLDDTNIYARDITELTNSQKNKIYFQLNIEPYSDNTESRVNEYIQTHNFKKSFICKILKTLEEYAESFNQSYIEHLDDYKETMFFVYA
ncbi:MAG: LPD29 domain-containing protein [Peptoanaerobacter stomatis]|uniref:LPD29 domain-containing protein n=1 Tax=Peptoanaerobacter stomatis TaxID=796937 RepID=UPI003FA10643